jgi:hypothetical protein
MSALALILAAGMVIGDGPGKVSGKMEEMEQGLDMRGKWGGKLQWGKWAASEEVRIIDGMLRSDGTPGTVYGCEIVEQGRGRVRIELCTAKYLGIYRRAGDEYIICFRHACEGWPTDFRSDSDHYWLTIHRLKTPAADTVELPKDVYEIETRQFTLPILGKPVELANVEKVRLFVSEDQGKNWKHKNDYKPSDKRAIFSAPRDGQYWFAVQVVLKDGRREPAELEDLAPATKVYVNSERRTLKSQKSYEELQREVEQLRGTVEQLQKKIKQLESNGKSK